MPRFLRETLEGLGFTGGDGLVSSETPPEVGTQDYVWRDLRTKVGLDAAFFQDGVPIVGFSAAGGVGVTELRKRLWNYGRVPLLVTARPGEVSAYNARGSSSAFGLADALVTDATRRAHTAATILGAFSRSEVEVGNYTREFAQAFESGTRVDTALLRNLAFLRQSVAQREPLKGTDIDTLIGGCLLASYMADRRVLDEEHMLELSGSSTLVDIFSSGKDATKRLFEGLAEHFNGDIFGVIPKTIDRISESDLRNVAGLLQGDDLPTGQQSLWPYDFSVLPTDLVSTVYEQLLEPTRLVDAAFYTPRFLVDLVLDEVLNLSNGIPTLIDLACGSGAFITEAFRRMVYHVRTLSRRAPSYDDLLELLQGHVFGVDKSESAVTVTIFGLYLALLEEMDPPTIWSTAILPRLLGINVVAGDAFSGHELTQRKFDVAVSNPPWGSMLTADASEYVRLNQFPVADQQIAEAFLWLANSVLRPGGVLGLVMPAKSLLHNRGPRAREFRAALFKQMSVRAIVDLSAVRRTVFDTAIAPAAVLVANSLDPDVADPKVGAEIVHLAPHPRTYGRSIDALVVVPEEVRMVRAGQALERPDIWRVLLWGGFRDMQLLDRLRLEFPTVADIKRDRKWISGQGFQVGGGGSNDASHMLGMPTLETTALQPFRVLEHGVASFAYESLHRPRDPGLYVGPHTVIRRTTVNGRLAAVFLDEDMAFRNGVLGFAGSIEDVGLLVALAATTVSSLGHYWHFMTSASWGVERDFVEVNEHQSLPLATPSAKQAEDLRALMSAAGDESNSSWRERLDEIVFDMYGLTLDERERVVEGLRHGLSRFQNPRAYDVSDVAGDIDAYSEHLCRALSGVLSDISVSAKTMRRGPYQSVAVTLNERVEPADAPFEVLPKIDVETIAQASRSPAGSSGVMSLPAGFYVDEDTFYIVKTMDLDRWTRDAALNDAERILAGLLGNDA